MPRPRVNESSSHWYKDRVERRVPDNHANSGASGIQGEAPNMHAARPARLRSSFKLFSSSPIKSVSTPYSSSPTGKDGPRARRVVPGARSFEALPQPFVEWQRSARSREKKSVTLRWPTQSSRRLSKVGLKEATLTFSQTNKAPAQVRPRGA
jgi:hypothetical protein